MHWSTLCLLCYILPSLSMLMQKKERVLFWIDSEIGPDSLKLQEALDGVISNKQWILEYNV